MKINNENYVNLAENRIKELKRLPSTSQIRNILSIASVIYDKARRSKSEKLSEEEKMNIQLLRVRLVYDSGKENSVRNFVQRTELLENLKEIKNRKELILFCKYMEALVAYHKFHGGQ